MPYGVLTDIFCIILGGIIGPNLNIKITYKYREPLIKIFGISALAIGIISFIKVNCLPCVILALILGFILGEFFDLDTKLKNLLAKIIYKLNFKHKFKNEEEKNLYMDFYLLVAATFCASGTNIFGAFNEGLSGDTTILFSKAVIDIFASIIFSTRLGYPMLLITIPQFIIMGGLFFCSQFLMVFISNTMILDFISIGGLVFIWSQKYLPYIIYNILPKILYCKFINYDIIYFNRNGISISTVIKSTIDIDIPFLLLNEKA